MDKCNKKIDLFPNEHKTFVCICKDHFCNRHKNNINWGRLSNFEACWDCGMNKKAHKVCPKNFDTMKSSRKNCGADMCLLRYDIKSEHYYFLDPIPFSHN